MKKTLLFLTCLSSLNLFAGDDTKNILDYVDPFVGTGFHGHTYPGATVPFGAVQLSPDTRRGDWDACSGYHYSDSTLLGFSHTHLTGTGCIDLGDLLLRPTLSPAKEGKQLYKPARFLHSSEKAAPGYYSVRLEDEGIQAELTATTYAGMHRYTFPKGKEAYVVVDLAHLLTDEFIYEAELKQTADNEIVGMRRTRGWVDNQYVYFVIQFNSPIASLELFNEGTMVKGKKELSGQHLQALLNFKKSKQVIAKVGLSVVSVDNARLNLAHDMKGFDFEAVCTQASDAWKKALSHVKIEGGTEAQRINFYTAWYHAMVVPNVVSDVNGQYRRHDMKIAAMPTGHKMYSTFSLWDTFRAWNPLFTMTDTGLVTDMINSMLAMYDASGELPMWPLSAGETGTMIGYHAVSVIADAYLKGIRGFDAEKALKAMIASSEKNKKGADYYIKHGFIPSNIKKESISCLLEFAYDDWAIAQMAKAMGKEEVYKTYIARSQNYMNVFDGKSKFFRGKRMDGNWDTAFNPFEVGRDYTEATAWQYRFFVPHDVNGMIQLFGGQDKFSACLDSLYTVTSVIDGHLSDITGLIGQYVHGNEPSHHMAYLYNYIGQPWKTQAMTRRLLDEMYAPTPEGIIGNEDCGQMSAWYILSAMGFYPVCPGSNEFSLTTPLFDKVELQLANGKTLVVKANNPAQHIYIEKVELNGRPITKNFITYEQLMQGGELCFTLSDQPNYARGTQAEAFPYSYTEGKMVSVPYVNKDLNLFLTHVDVEIASATDGSTIHYTLDGTDPTEASPVYTQPLMVGQTTTIKAKAFKEGYAPSRMLTIQATKAELLPAAKAEGKQPGTAYTYVEGYFQKVDEMKSAVVVEQGIMVEPSIAKARQADHFGYTFKGVINVPEDGVYTFGTKSDDGSVLYIDGVKVVDNDGSHAAITATGRIALKKGFHTYELQYFEDYEGEHLSWEWTLPGKQQAESIPKELLFVK